MTHLWLHRHCAPPACVITLMALLAGASAMAEQSPTGSNARASIALPQPRLDGDVALEQALLRRHSVREFDGQPLSLRDVSQLIWASQGITEAGPGRRTAPSAGATYPLEVLLVAGDVTGLQPGVYRYLPDGHELVMLRPGDCRRELASAALAQMWLADAPAVLVITGVIQRTAARYGGRAERYVQMEAGHAGQNVYLQAAALELGTVVVGAFRDTEVKSLLGLPDEERPLSLMPIGKPRR